MTDRVIDRVTDRVIDGVTDRVADGVSDRGIDQPRGNSAAYTVLTTGYTLSTGPGVAATVSYVRDGDRRVFVDPGMAAHRDRILGPLAELGLGPDDITDVALSRHHPDNTLNVASSVRRASMTTRRSGTTSRPTGTPRAMNSRRPCA